MPKIILTRGIQGSGKSTWAKKWAEEDSEHRIRWNNDDFRRMLGKYWVPKRENPIGADIITNTYNKHKDVIENIKNGKL